MLFFRAFISPSDRFWTLVENKKLSYRSETAYCFASLNISLSHSRSLKVIRNGTTRNLGYGFLLAFHSNCGSILYHHRDKARG